ncbi:MAG TPA: TolC family protein [Puia sp.]|nr:TolC family protein [Puia sp.]
MKNAVKRFKATLIFFLPIYLFNFSNNVYSQSNSDSTESLTLGQCIDYALKHQPLLQQSLINIDITRSTNKINLAGWLPQAYISGNFTHYLQLPSAISDSTNGKAIRTGVTNTFVPALTVTQTIFNPTLLYASRSAPLYVRQAEQITDSTKIFLVSAVSKSFYNLLQTLEQIDVLKEDTARLDKNLSDTYHQYIAGTVDETDYDEAGITLNNSKAQLKQETESIIPQYAMLKQVMGYPPLRQFNVSFDTTQMMRDIAFDTTQQLQFEKRIEFQQLQTSKSLQHQVTSYYRNAFLPTVSAVFNYTPEFESYTFPTLFGNVYPYSYIGLSVSLPLFTGFARLENVHKSQLQERLLDWDEVNLKSQIYIDYTSALANYKSNLYNYEIMKDNEEKAKRVYGIVQLQYLQGIVAYLNVITAESNLISSEIGYVNALFQLLSSKIDLQKAMGVISY